MLRSTLQKGGSAGGGELWHDPRTLIGMISRTTDILHTVCIKINIDHWTLSLFLDPPSKVTLVESSDLCWGICTCQSHVMSIQVCQSPAGIWLDSIQTYLCLCNFMVCFLNHTTPVLTNQDAGLFKWYNSLLQVWGCTKAWQIDFYHDRQKVLICRDPWFWTIN